jgi:hypothetical protein
VDEQLAVTVDDHEVALLVRDRVTLTNWTMPGFVASCLDCSETRDAVPPTWNVRIVSWVPGSPIDSAAMTPTASPISTSLPLARLRP